jgi:hypothetical protein
MRGTFSLRPITAEVTAADVRAEAGRRIEAIMPDYKQHNVMVWGLETMMPYGTRPGQLAGGAVRSRVDGYAYRVTLPIDDVEKAGSCEAIRPTQCSGASHGVPDAIRGLRAPR